MSYIIPENNYIEMNSDTQVFADKKKEKLKLLEKLLSDSNWELVKENDDITMKRKFLKGSKIACFKSNGLIKAGMDELVDFIWNTFDSKENMLKNDQSIMEYDVIENIDDNNRICRQINSLPWPIRSREFVFMQTKVIDEERTYVLMFSVDYDGKIPKTPNWCVKATINISGFVFEQEKDSCMVHRLAHINPAGFIPIPIINNYSDKTMLMIKKMKEIYD